ncbi:TerD family protein [Rhabdochromatium marinum]|uniref:TerD family protein n=1 Tax=Rhabdochromatium marinum TaxID=48729 RepID=UPI001908B3D9|nr:TerD family protein [Rhabdochromatium marinum]MBK1648345.1 hypothetical protein [Rhabdochromatium marinum]
MPSLLRKGANAVLTDTGQVQVQLLWNQAQIALDAVCFALGAQGQVPDDRWFLFYNQPQSSDGAIRLDLTKPGQAELTFELDRLPAQIERCVIAATVDSGNLRHAPDTRLIATATATRKQLVFELTEAGDEQALMFAELYRHRHQWKLRAVGQGFQGGLKPLAEHFGVAVADDTASAPAPASPPAPAPTPVPPVSPPSGSGSRPEPDSTLAPRRSRGALWLVLGVLLLSGLGAGSWFFLQQHSAAPADASNANAPKNSAPKASPPATPPPPARCALEDSEVMEQYHRLGENYVRILEQIDLSNQRLGQLRRALKQADTECPADFLSNNQTEISLLEQFAIDEWMDRAVMLNTCAGRMITRIEQQLEGESRPVVLQRLLREADHARNLESDLTNISRDMAYLRNKAERLRSGYRENIAACAP